MLPCAIEVEGGQASMGQRDTLGGCAMLRRDHNAGSATLGRPRSVALGRSPSVGRPRSDLRSRAAPPPRRSVKRWRPRRWPAPRSPPDALRRWRRKRWMATEVGKTTETIVDSDGVAFNRKALEAEATLDGELMLVESHSGETWWHGDHAETDCEQTRSDETDWFIPGHPTRPRPWRSPMSCSRRWCATGRGRGTGVLFG